MKKETLKLILFWGVITAWTLIMFSSCTKKYKCMRYKGTFDVYYNPKQQSCYYNFKGQKENLTKEQCASLCYEDY
jgi:hypothetical protein